MTNRGKDYGVVICEYPVFYYSCRLSKLFTYRSYITVAIFKTLYSKAPNQRTPTSGTVPKVRN